MKALKMKKYPSDKSKQGQRPASSAPKGAFRTGGKPSVRAKKEDAPFSTERKRPSSRPQASGKPSSRDRKDPASFDGERERRPTRPQATDRPRSGDRKESASFSEDRNRRPSRPQVTDRPRSSDRKESASFSEDRNRRPTRPQATDRPRSGDRKESSSFSEDRNRRPSRPQSTDRPSFRDRKESSPFSEDRNRRPSRPQSTERPSFRDRKETSSFTDDKRRKPSHLNTTVRSGVRVRREPLPVAAPVEKKAKAPRLEGALLWGVHAVSEAWLNPNRTCVSLRLSDSGFTALQEVFKKAEVLGLSRPEPLRVERPEIDAFLPRGTVHQGILLQTEPLAELTLDDLLGAEKSPSLVLVLDQVTDPHNVGAILRSAAAFGADAVIVTERNAPGTTGILAKTASGAVEHVPLISVVNLARTIETLQAESFWCVGLAEEGDKDLSESKLSSGKIALVLGAEGDGLRRLTREHCDELARLPTSGPVGSLNVSNAAVVSLYEVTRQRG